MAPPRKRVTGDRKKSKFVDDLISNQFFERKLHTLLKIPVNSTQEAAEIVWNRNGWTIKGSCLKIFISPISYIYLRYVQKVYISFNNRSKIKRGKLRNKNYFYFSGISGLFDALSYTHSLIKIKKLSQLFIRIYKILV